MITLADRWPAERLNHPNDVVVRSDDSIRPTDPSCGIDSDDESHQFPSEIGPCQLCRLDPATGGAAEVHQPEIVANSTFGGFQGNRLFMAASTSLYSIMLNVTGARRPAAPQP